MDLVELLDLVIGGPDRRQTGCLCGHNVHADTIISRQVCNTVSDELHYFIINITICENSTDDRQSDILWTNALLWLSCQIYSDHARHIDVICTG